MNKLITPLLLCLSVTACAPTIYNKAGGTQEEFMRTKMKCQLDTMRSNPYAGYGLDPIVIEMQKADMFKMCMQIEGWNPR